MSADLMFAFHCVISFGLPLLFAWHQLRGLRKGGGDWRDKVPEPAPAPPRLGDGVRPKPLPPGLVPEPSPWLPPVRGPRVLEDA